MISSPYLSNHQVAAVFSTTEALKNAVEIVIRRLFKLVAVPHAPLINGGWDRGVIVRCGALGSCIARQRYGAGCTSQEEVELRWIGAYWTAEVTPEFQSHVVDVTGGGNAFLGGLAAGMKLTGGDLLEGMRSLSPAMKCSELFSRPTFSCISCHDLRFVRYRTGWSAKAVEGPRWGRGLEFGYT